jgi:pimeloyl-ACP methyl ester carboxylesterase
MGDCLSRFDLRDRLHEIEIPVFVYVGRYDWITQVKLSEDLAGGIKGSKLVVYGNSGHMAALEEKTKFQKHVREFLKSLNIEGLGS